MKGKRYTVLCYVYAVGWAGLSAFWLLMECGVIHSNTFAPGEGLPGLIGLGFAGLAAMWLVRAIKRTKNPPEEE